jgi:hypothetical protein
MMLKYAIALAVLIVVAAVFTWAFLPARYLPGNRARHLRIRLHLRLHPGKGFAHLFSLWLRWGRLAALRRSGRIRAMLPLWYRIAEPRQHSVFLGRAHYRHGLRVPKSTCWSWRHPAPIRRRSWPMSSCATPARSSPPPPKPTSTT